MPERIYNVLFLCTGNSARSILAESILRRAGAEHFRAFSAGSHPKGAIHPLALHVLTVQRCPTDGLRSKSMVEFARTDAPVMDLVVTVCDAAAGESCPSWPGDPVLAHWGIEDPAGVTGTDMEKELAFFAAYRLLRSRIATMIGLKIGSLDIDTLRRRLSEIGRSERVTL
jgi:protein-tyrosine-phosphatase